MCVLVYNAIRTQCWREFNPQQWVYTMSTVLLIFRLQVKFPTRTNETRWNDGSSSCTCSTELILLNMNRDQGLPVMWWIFTGSGRFDQQVGEGAARNTCWLEATGNNCSCRNRRRQPERSAGSWWFFPRVMTSDGACVCWREDGGRKPEQGK